MSEVSPVNFRIDGLSDLYFRHAEPPNTESMLYKPALLIECRVNFRSIRAGLNYSEERSYTAWLPEGDLAVDWQSPAVDFDRGSQVVSIPDPLIPFAQGDYRLTRGDFDVWESGFFESLVRNERLEVYFNPVFGLFASPGEKLETFLIRVAEAALLRVEPEMKKLRSRFELQLEQIREAHSGRGFNQEEVSMDRMIFQNLRFFESENRLAGMFSTLAGAVFGTIIARPEIEGDRSDIELREDLARVEQEAGEALHSLYSEYLTVANEYDTFDIGLQPGNIQITRRAILWIPTPVPQ